MTILDLWSMMTCDKHLKALFGPSSRVLPRHLKPSPPHPSPSLNQMLKNLQPLECRTNLRSGRRVDYD